MYITMRRPILVCPIVFCICHLWKITRAQVHPVFVIYLPNVASLVAYDFVSKEQNLNFYHKMTPDNNELSSSLSGQRVKKRLPYNKYIINIKSMLDYKCILYYKCITNVWSIPYNRCIANIELILHHKYNIARLFVIYWQNAIHLDFFCYKITKNIFMSGNIPVPGNIFVSKTFPSKGIYLCQRISRVTEYICIQRMCLYQRTYLC